ncbi:Coiled-coil domain-containing protein 96 [Physocladia obscura]|uniref:Coiled-coil domain-containing protein 96 n=1 Tax=Physocladia obscura TaxID=109957 RepID=A0AAD5T3E8_9FUNG|nr:Coiled-coil domain-containing protein 96 [Physocladia obscura]
MSGARVKPVEDEESGYGMGAAGESGSARGFARVPTSEGEADSATACTTNTGSTSNSCTNNSTKQKADVESLFSASAISAIIGSIISSVAIVMVNKLALNNGFPYASSLTALHQLTVYIFTTILIKTKSIPALPEPLPASQSRPRYIVAALYSSGLVLMNQSLAMNPVAFYQLLKMSCIPAIAFFQYLLFNKVVNRPTGISLGVILLGVAISTMAPTNAQAKNSQRADEFDTKSAASAAATFFSGFLTLIVSISAVSTTVLSQIEVSMNPDLKRLSSFQVMNAMSVLSFVVCIVAALFIDVKISLLDFLNPESFGAKIAVFVDSILAEAPLGWVLFSCVLSIVVNLFGTNLIKYTSPMTFQVVGHLKTMLTLGIGALLFGAGGLDGLKGVGVLVALVGMGTKSKAPSLAASKRGSRANISQLQSNLVKHSSQNTISSTPVSTRQSQTALAQPDDAFQPTETILNENELQISNQQQQQQPESADDEILNTATDSAVADSRPNDQKPDDTDASVEARLSATLDKITSQLSIIALGDTIGIDSNGGCGNDESLIEVGDEIEVIPQVARTLTSPLLKQNNSFTFVHADYAAVVGANVAISGGDVDDLGGGGSGVAAALSVVPFAQQVFMRSESFFEADGDLFGCSGCLTVGVARFRTPIMRPSSPTWVPPIVEANNAEGDIAAVIEIAQVAVSVAIVEEEIIDREALIASIKQQLDLKEKLQAKNSFLQNKLGEYFKRKRTDDVHDSEKSVADQEQLYQGPTIRYANCMTALSTLRTEYESLNSTNSKIVNEYKSKLGQHSLEASERGEEFVKFKRATALAAENSRTGKSIPTKTVAQLEATDQRKEMEVAAVRLDHIKLRNKLKRHEQLLRQKEELADGLHLIDFEQLKIENQTYNEKIEERNEELLKLRKKITNIVQVLTHVKEKLQFVQAENSNLRKDLKCLDRDVAVRRDSLPASKQARDGIKNLNNMIRQKNGLLGNKPLLRDFEEKVPFQG